MKKSVYLISPSKINKNFYKELDKVLSYKNVKFFQLRLKNTKKNSITKIANKVKRITKKHNVKFILNDDFFLAKRIGADGCHMGQLDGSLKVARNKLKNKILGITCHNSKILAKNALKFKPDYIAFGSFHKSKLKPQAIRSNLNILQWAKKSRFGFRWIVHGT